MNLEVDEVDLGIRLEDLVEEDTGHRLGPQAIVPDAGGADDLLAVARRGLSDEEAHGTARGRHGRRHEVVSNGIYAVVDE